mgnify:CR=1 FL=1
MGPVGETGSKIALWDGYPHILPGTEGFPYKSYTFYFGGGVGYATTSLDGEVDKIENNDEDGGFAWQLIAGVDFPIVTDDNPASHAMVLVFPSETPRSSTLIHLAFSPVRGFDHGQGFFRIGK